MYCVVSSQSNRAADLPRTDLTWFFVLTIALVAVLYCATWSLWTHQSVFPRVPLFEFATGLSSTWTAGAGILIIVGLFGLGVNALQPLFRSWFAIAYLTGFALAVLLDQHRMQAWAIHFALVLGLWQLSRPHRLRVNLQWLTIGIYVYSALSKLDSQFLHTVGQDFLWQVLRFLRIDEAEISETTRWGLAAGFPIGELLVGVALAIPRVRRLGAVAAIGMHGMLIAIFSPIGLNHQAGVMLWNGLFMVQVYWLFLAPGIHFEELGSTSGPQTNPKPHVGAAETLLILVMILPLGERIGVVDHWLGWALYAPHSSRVQVFVAEDCVQQLPKEAWVYAPENSVAPLGWRRVDIDKWSLGVLHAPINPQQRVQFGVARAVASVVPEAAVRVDLLSASSRWSGKRTIESLQGRTELESASQRFWFNTRPAQ